MKNRVFFIVSKGVLACYLIIFSMSYLTDNTSAYFITNNQVNGVLTAGEWELDINLEFQQQGNQNIKTCPSTITVVIQNIGQDNMQEEGLYEVYYAEKGNPKNGVKLDLSDSEGVIPALASGETVELTFSANQEGFYMFKAFSNQEKLDEESTWSEKIKCKSHKQTEEQSEPVENVEDLQEEQPTTTPTESSEENVKKENEETKTSEQESPADDAEAPDEQGESEADEAADEAEENTDTDNPVNVDEPTNPEDGEGNE
jgi:YqxM protein